MGMYFLIHPQGWINDERVGRVAQPKTSQVEAVNKFNVFKFVSSPKTKLALSPPKEGGLLMTGAKYELARTTQMAPEWENGSQMGQ